MFLDLENDLWSHKSLSSLAPALGRPVGAVCLGKPNYRPSAMVGVIVKYDFDFPKSLSIKVADPNGNVTDRHVRVAYPCKP